MGDLLRLGRVARPSARGDVEIGKLVELVLIEGGAGEIQGLSVLAEGHGVVRVRGGEDPLQRPVLSTLEPDLLVALDKAGEAQDQGILAWVPLLLFDIIRLKVKRKETAVSRGCLW